MGTAGWTDGQQSRSQHRHRTRANGCSDPPVSPPKPHHQQLEQCRHVPVPRGVEEQHPHFGAAAGRTDRWPVLHGDPQHHHRQAHPTMSLLVVSPPYSWGLSRWRAVWRNQRTQAWTLLVVWAPSRYHVTGPRGSTWVRPSHSVSRSPGAGGTEHGWDPPPAPGPQWGRQPGCAPQHWLVARCDPPEPLGTVGGPVLAIPHLGSWRQWVERRVPVGPASPPARCLAAPPAPPRVLQGTSGPLRP